MTSYEIETYTSTYDELGNILKAHGGLSYFDSITSSTGEENAFLTTLTKGSSSIVITETNKNVYTPLEIDNYVFAASFGAYTPRRIKKVFITDNAIVLIPHTGFRAGEAAPYTITYADPIVICKSVSGETVVSFNLNPFTNETNTSKTITVISIDANGTKNTRETPFLQNNTSDAYLCATPIPTFDDITKNVYLDLHRPFYAMAEPFMLTVGDASHASFGYNTILVKTQ